MTAYASGNPKTKTELRKWLEAGKDVRVTNLTPLGNTEVKDGVAYLSGPHYPQPHTWYAEVLLENGKIVKLDGKKIKVQVAA